MRTGVLSAAPSRSTRFETSSARSPDRPIVFGVFVGMAPPLDNDVPRCIGTLETSFGRDHPG